METLRSPGCVIKSIIWFPEEDLAHAARHGASHGAATHVLASCDYEDTTEV